MSAGTNYSVSLLTAALLVCVCLQHSSGARVENKISFLAQNDCQTIVKNAKKTWFSQECYCPGGQAIAGNSPKCEQYFGKRYFPKTLSGGGCTCRKMNGTPWKVKVWKHTVEPPEWHLRDFQGKPPSAIGLGGGGTRAHILSVGYLRGLKILGVLGQARLLAANSGSAWSAAMVAYYQKHTSGEQTVNSLDAYLGIESVDYPPSSSEKLKRLNLSKIPHSPFELSLEDQSSNAASLSKILSTTYLGQGPKFYKDYIQKQHLNDVGIGEGDFFAADEQHKTDIESRFGAAPHGTALLPQRSMPYLSVGCALVGPTDLGSLVNGPDNKPPPFTRLLVTPLYTGSYVHADRKFWGDSVVLGYRSSKIVDVGGFVETVAFGNSYLQVDGQQEEETANVTVDMKRPFTINDALTCSSFAPAGEFAMGTRLKYLAGRLQGMRANFWSPDDIFTEHQEPRQSEVAIGDGGLVQNFPLIELILRGIKCPIMFGNFYTPIASSYNPRTDEFSETAPTNTDIRALFFDPGDRKDLRGLNYRENKIFKSEDWVRLIEAFQAKQKRGEPLIATLKHRTVANAWWGMPEGEEVYVTWVYNSKSDNFMNNYFKEKSEKNEFLEAWKKKYDADFPAMSTYKSSQSDISKEEVRVLYLHATMLVLDNQETFKQAAECKLMHRGNSEEPW